MINAKTPTIIKNNTPMILDGIHFRQSLKCLITVNWCVTANGALTMVTWVTQRQRQRDRDRGRGRDTGRDRGRYEAETKVETEVETETDKRQRKTETETETKRDRDRETKSDRESLTATGNVGKIVLKWKKQTDRTSGKTQYCKIAYHNKGQS